MKFIKITTAALLVTAGVSVGTVQAETPEDPWEGFNRSMYTFNDALDRAVLKPVAQGYKAVMPAAGQRGVSNFFSNLGEISNIANNLLQGKWDRTAASSWRFIINSTAGWFGLFDIASELGLKQANEDFGQTLGYWGVSSGPYLVLPLFGPSTVRDTGGMVVDWQNYGKSDIYDLTWEEDLGLDALGIIQLRANLLSAEGLVIGDRYTFIRDVYLQSRANAIRDGQAPQNGGDEFSSEGSWGDEESDSWGDDSWDDGSSWDEESY